MSLATDMYCVVCEETRKEIDNTMKWLREIGEGTPEQYYNVCHYYYERDNTPSEDWFNYWEY